MKWLKRAWIRWRMDAVDEMLTDYQARGDVGPYCLCNLMQHRNDLEWKLAALS